MMTVLDDENKGKIPVDRGWAWVCLLGAFINMAFVVGGFKTLGILFVEFGDRFESSAGVTALALSFISGFMSLFSPVSNIIMAAYSNRVACVFGSICVATAAFVTQFAENMTFVICIFGVFTGIGYAFLFTPSLVVVGQCFDHYRPLANGLALAGASVGQLVLPQLLTFFLREYSLRGTLLIHSALLLHMVAASLLFRPKTFYTRWHGTKSSIKTNTLLATNTEEEQRPLKSPKEEVVVDESIQNPPQKLNIKSCDSGPQPAESMNSPLQHKHDLVGSLDSHTFRKSLLASMISTPYGKGTDSDTSIPKSLNLTASVEAHLDKLEGGASSMYTEDHSVRGPHAMYTSTGSLCIGPLPNDTDAASIHGQAYQSLGGATQAETHSPDGAEDNALQKPNKCHKFSWIMFGCPLTETSSNSQPVFDCMIFTNSTFLLMLSSICVSNLGYLNVVLFTPAFAKEIDLNQDEAASILSVIGFSDLIGRIIGGIFANFRLVKTTYLMAVTIGTTAAVVAISASVPSYWSLICMAVVLGALGGAYVALFPLLIMDCMGPEKFPAALALFVMTAGIFNLGLPALVGVMFDQLGSYAPSFYLCASMMAFGAVVFLFLEIHMKRDDILKTKHSSTEGVNDIEKKV